MQESNHLLEGIAFTERLASRLASAQHRVLVVSAFLTAHATQWLREQISVHVPVYLVARWLPQDLLSGASDTESWRLAKSYGWDFRAQRRLHAKVYLIDSAVIFVGSANATTKGLALGNVANIEIGVQTVPTSADVASIESLVDAAESVPAALVERIEIALQRLTLQLAPCELLDWPTDVWPQTSNMRTCKNLCVSECFMTDGGWLKSGQVVGLESAIAHDLSLLGISATYLPGPKSRMDQLQTAFRHTKEYGWLMHALRREPQGTASFGRLSAILHDTLIDDPRPYRSSVKQLLGNLLGWVAVLGDGAITLSRPRHTMIVKAGEP
jgi:hypothetical protein